MTEKTEAQIEKDKEAVQKMIGAKSAMEAAIRHIDTLEGRLKTIDAALRQYQSSLGEEAYVRTNWHGLALRCQSDAKIIKASEFISLLRMGISEVV